MISSPAEIAESGESLTASLAEPAENGESLTASLAEPAESGESLTASLEPAENGKSHTASRIHDGRIRLAVICAAGHCKKTEKKLNHFIFLSLLK